MWIRFSDLPPLARLSLSRDPQPGVYTPGSWRFRRKRLDFGDLPD